MAKFITELEIRLKPYTDNVWIVSSPLVYMSETVGNVVVPSGFETDLASVPRIPFVFEAWGDRVHREGVLHDYLYRSDSKPCVSRSTANKVFLEAIKCRGNACSISVPMYLGVCLGGWKHYHKKKVGDKL